MEYELSCRYATAKSFYGKAIVKEETTRNIHGYTILKNLYSYGTLVAKVLYSFIDNKKEITYLYMGRYSQTTTRHQKEFFKQEGLDDNQIKKLMNSEENELTIKEAI